MYPTARALIGAALLISNVYASRLSYVDQATRSMAASVDQLKANAERHVLAPETLAKIEENYNTLLLAMAADAIADTFDRGTSAVLQAVVHTHNEQPAEAAKVLALEAVENAYQLADLDKALQNVPADNSLTPDQKAAEIEAITARRDEALATRAQLTSALITVVEKAPIQEDGLQALQSVIEATLTEFNQDHPESPASLELQKLFKNVTEIAATTVQTPWKPVYDYARLVAMYNEATISTITGFLSNRTGNVTATIAAVGDSIKGFFGAYFPLFADYNMYKKLPVQLYLNMSLFNELHQDLSGTPYLCAAAQKVKRARTSDSTKINEACKMQLDSLFLKSGLGGFDEIDNSQLPNYVKEAIKVQFGKQAHKRLHEVQEATGKIQQWYEEKKTQLEAGLKQRQDALNIEGSDDDDAVDFGESTNTSENPHSSPILLIGSKAYLPTAPHIVHGASSSDVDVVKTVSDKINAAIGAKSSLNPDDYTADEIKIISENPELVTLFVTNVDATKLAAKKEHYSKDLCGKARKDIDALPEGPLRKAWNETCAAGMGIGMILLIVCGVVVLAAGLVLGAYFWFRPQN
ncbi:hypothetical protein PSACC_02479 [Paramicrosporidium saccamoebae]|uniref:Secreted protein n=1 Tax=Paramicrosporidium saccamoebae TaxID=1246581 RepID=A0A2H9TIX9_9FUNG|nr:hypothetical protein PSACC_02479 [Paramicrosporidium saccamoebae]